MRKYISNLPVLLLFFALIACSSGNEEPLGDKPTSSELTFEYDKVTPVDFPSLNIPGFEFPMDSTLLNQWIAEDDSINIYKHGWGIWAGLTAPTNQKVGEKTLLVYETWLTPEEMIDSLKNQPIKRSNRANLNKPNQFTHFVSTVNDSIHESVAYSPAASNYAIEEKIFLATTLLGYAEEGRNSIPDFPNDAITIKPVFKVLPVSSSGDQTKFAISVWPGPIDSLAGFPEKDWHSSVYIDITNQSNGNGSRAIYPDSNTPPAPTDSTTYNLNDFIHYKMNKEDAHYFNKEFSENASNRMTAKPGDVVILVGMHVTTKENKRWTWQTFWWAPDANKPLAPSSKTIADQRPMDALSRAASHYAMSTAYYMVNPQEPYSGENVTGTPNYAFNPYLESGFGPNVFNDKISVINTSAGNSISTSAGVRTNCMSCHAMATINPDSLGSGSNSGTPYVGDSYVSLSDTIFEGQLKLDFAWSIQGNIDTTGLKAYLEEN
ncbi:hypothetical protein [Fodinibius salsisoli]|uniref:Cytochrome c domain-containing protein n=1 Tax=Fodinibius salsisoli TaxID=2820877 RepID=A0ABT3PRC5_9BACT|nr:hypothetical protein [Fodinibius salsisoli]MCW9708417.1 hypothetical protein [Fodinibius salsisoli]